MVFVRYSQILANHFRPLNWALYDLGMHHASAEFNQVIRSEMLDGLVDEYCDSFSNIDINTANDKNIIELVNFWRSCDEQQKGFIRSLMRFSSQNSLASLLALIDNTSFCFEANNELGIKEFKLNAETSEGEVSLEQYLSDVFWEQEEEYGHVN